MELRVIFELLAYLILFTYPFEKGLSRLGKLVEICSNSKKKLSAFYRFLLRCAVRIWGAGVQRWDKRNDGMESMDRSGEVRTFKSYGAADVQ